MSLILCIEHATSTAINARTVPTSSPPPSTAPAIREEKSARGQTKQLDLRAADWWQSRNLANEASDVIGLAYLEIFGVGVNDVNRNIRGWL